MSIINIANQGKNFNKIQKEIPILNPEVIIQQSISEERLSRYMIWSAQDKAEALRLYTLNTKLSESLYTPLQILEITLRNRIHHTMETVHSAQWLRNDEMIVFDHQRMQIAEACQSLDGAGKEITPGRIIAALSFSFWTSMVAPEYENLWQKTLHKLAKRKDGKGLTRKEFSRPLAKIRTLRNRVAHYEPIIHWNLPKYYGEMVQLIEWMCPDAATWCRQSRRFRRLYPSERIVLHRE